jgi:hypothetical protein
LIKSQWGQEKKNQDVNLNLETIKLKRKEIQKWVSKLSVGANGKSLHHSTF